MCTALSLNLYCTNFKCPHNLFWEKLSLSREKIQMTDKALEIRNCCCLIKRPWAPEEIAEAWGLTKERIKQSEAAAWRKLERVSFRRLLRKASPSQFLPHKHRAYKSGLHSRELIH